MHVAARIGIAAGLGLAGGAVVGHLLDDDSAGPATGSSAALMGVGGGITALQARNVTRLAGSPMPSGFGLAGVAIGSGLVGMGIASLGRGRSTAQQPPRVPSMPELSRPLPSPSPGPAPVAPSPRTTVGDALRGGASGGGGGEAIEAEVERYGPDGEWLGTDHGTLVP